MSDQPIDNQPTNSEAQDPEPEKRGGWYDPSVAGEQSPEETTSEASGGWQKPAPDESSKENLWHQPDSAEQPSPAPPAASDQAGPLPGAWHVPDTPPPSASATDYSSEVEEPGGWHVPADLQAGDLLSGVDATIHPAPQPAGPASTGEGLILTGDFPDQTPAAGDDSDEPLILTDDYPKQETATPFMPSPEPAPVDEETSAVPLSALGLEAAPLGEDADEAPLPTDDPAAIAAVMAARLAHQAEPAETAEQAPEPETASGTAEEDMYSPAAIAAARVAELTGKAIPAAEEEAGPGLLGAPGLPGGEEPTPEPEATTPLARLIAQFDNVEEQVHRLREMYQQGVLSHEALQAELRKLMILDEQGVWWMVGMESDVWYRFDNGQWVQAERPRLSTPGAAGQKAGAAALGVDDEPDVSITLDEDGMPVVHRVPREDPEATLVGASAVQFGELGGQTTMPHQAAGAAAIPAAGRDPLQPDYDAYAPDESDLYRKVQDEQATRRRTLITRFVVIGAVLTLVLSLVVIVGGVLFYMGRAGNYSDRIDELSTIAGNFQTTRIFDVNGNLLTQINDPTGGARISVPLEEISPFLIHATIATENERFYQDPGWDLTAIIRAAFQNVQQGGDIISGASTITQQLAKILVLEPERRTEISNARKIDEAIIAAEIGRRYSKNDILELYLNEIYYGNLAYGAEAAAQTYFGISARDLNLPQSAFLAAIVGAPAIYDPVTNRDAVFERMNAVINHMLEQGCIEFQHAPYASTGPFCVTQETVDAALVERAMVEVGNYSVPANRSRYPHFVNFVAQQLQENYGLADIYRAGFNVFTTIDPSVQDTAQAAVNDHLATLASQGRGGNNASVVVMDPRDGRILAMIGSADFNNEEIDGQVNVAFTPQQPGSSIKPLVYVTAFQGNNQGQYWYPGTVVWDTDTCWGGYCPDNYDLSFHGPQSVRTALANSYNIPAVKALDFVGVDRFVQVAQTMGLTFPGRPPQEAGLSGALGGFDVRLIDMVVAFGVLANNGQRVQPYAITAITDNAGNEIPLPARPEAQQVIQPAHAYLVTHILSDDVARSAEFGRNSTLNIPGYSVAAKTGTSTDNRDNWTIGYAPNVVVGVWHGNTDNSPMSNTSGFSGAAPIWNRVITTVLQREPALQFNPPAGVGTIEICADSGTLPSAECLNRRQELVAQAQLPPGPENDLFRSARVDTLTGLVANEFCPNFTDEQTFLNISDATAFAWINNTGAGQAWAEARRIPLPAQPIPTESCNPNIQTPTIIIDWPVPNAEVQGLVEVRGRVVVFNFNRYQIEYGIGPAPEAFALIDGPYTIMHSTSELLGSWDVSQLPNGPYTLRLNVVTNDGGYANLDHVVLVNNPVATETPLPTAMIVTPTPTPTWTPLIVTATSQFPTATSTQAGPIVVTATPSGPIVVTATPPPGPVVITNTPAPEASALPPRNPALDVPIVYGALANGIINNADFADTYVFNGQAGDVVQISAESTLGDLDTYIYLMDANGTIIAEDDDGANIGTDSLLTYTLSAPGQYLIVITRYEVSAGASAGEYRMTLNKTN